MCAIKTIETKFNRFRARSFFSLFQQIQLDVGVNGAIFMIIIAVIVIAINAH